MGGFSAVLATVVAFATTFLLGFWAIPFLKRLHFGQTILEDGPKWHKSKQGTPTMGGILMVFGLFVAVLVAVVFALLSNNSLKAELLFDKQRTVRWVAAITLALGMGAVGFLDDYIKVVKKRNLGLTARQKTFAQLVLAAAYLITLLFSGMQTTRIPFVGDVNIMSGFGLIFWPVALLFIYGFVNAVNLTDGVDGLASSVSLVVCCAFMVMAGVTQNLGCNMLAAAGAGCCIGFIMWNSHPAKVFMGDTGSLMLGGLVVGLSFAVDYPILLIPAGIVYLLEALSVILQVSHYKRTKKRIFKMTPIHHHFEMCGWSEEKIVFVFSFVTLLGCILAILPVYFR